MGQLHIPAAALLKVRRLLIAAAALVAALAVVPEAESQTLLRWKLEKGQKLSVAVVQETQSETRFSSKAATNKIQLAMDLSWEVLAASEGEFKVKQTIESVRASYAGSGGTAEFDSAKKMRATGPAKSLAEQMQGLVGAEVEIVFTPRGEVTSVTPTNETGRALAAAPAGGNANGVSAGTSLVQIVSQSILPLPEKEVAKGDEWKTSRRIESAAGAIEQEMTYALAELLERDGQRLGKIIMTGRLAESAGQKGEAAALRIKSHEQTGSAVFLIAEGRPLEMEQQQKLQTERVYRETTIEVSLASSLKMTFRDAAASDEQGAKE